MKRIFFLLIFGGFLLNGCSDDMPPPCDSQETKKLLNQVIQKNINEYLLKEVVSTFKTVGHEKIEEHKNAKEYSCEARLIIHYTDGEIESDLISYSVFSDTSNRSKFYVQITE